MGTHPIFESDFDCLTEWHFFNKNLGRQAQAAAILSNSEPEK